MRRFTYILMVLALLTMPAQILDAQTENPAPMQRISLDLKGIDIIELFRILSLKMGVTIVPTKNVSGRINVFLNNLTLDDALDVVLNSQDLACEKSPGIINVMTSDEYLKLYGRKYNEKRKFNSYKLNYAKPSTVFNALAQVKSDVGKIIVDETSATIFLMDTPERLVLMEKTIKDLDQAPETAVFDLQYAKTDDIKSQLSGVITPGAGEMLVDSRSTRVVVSDLPDRMKKIKRIISAFDTEIPQVEIETRIAEITLRDEYQRQINWQRIFEDIHNLSLAGTFPASPSWSVSPALSVASMLMSVGTLESDKYTAALKFLQTLGDTKVLSQPKVIALNNQEAKIMVGSREAYVIQSLSQATASTVSAENIQFIDVGVKLSVMPTVHRDGFITLKIKPEVSSVRETITTAMGSIVPIVNTSEVDTVVKVKDGTMIMIGGLVKEDKRSDTTGVPGIAKTFLGPFFGSRATLKKRTEMVVFLIPRIIKGDVSTTKEDLRGVVSKDLVPGLADHPLATVLPKDNTVSGINIQQKLKGPKEY
ncbi:MAG: secretin N-terminal domain-containing protein [Candidatus Omnitrophica bacterium]|nr:secretin N-terminal domain-containing protein [Candidatus Omnitrophota bacterium]MDD5653429.1 secretin N-terminal domain-containing protein [Candidatus Omnitrophota bacterium]